LLPFFLLCIDCSSRLLGDLEAHNEVLMAVALLEVVRRWQWVFVRVETETRRLGLLTPLEDGLSTSKTGDGLEKEVAASAGVSRVASSDGVAFGGDRADVRMHLHGLLRGHVHSHVGNVQDAAAVAVPLLKA
jgi:hypothetical protein